MGDLERTEHAEQHGSDGIRGRCTRGPAESGGGLSRLYGSWTLSRDRRRLEGATTEVGTMEQPSNLRRAALYGVAGLMTAAIGATAVNAFVDGEPDKPAQAASIKPTAAPTTSSEAPKPAPAPEAKVLVPEPAPVEAAAPVQMQVPVAQPIPQPVALVEPLVEDADPVAEVPVTAPAAVPVAVPVAKAVAHKAAPHKAWSKPKAVKHAPKPAHTPKATTDVALKKALGEQEEATKKVKREESELASAKKDLAVKKAEVQKIKKSAEKPKPKPAVAPVLTKKTSPDMTKRLQQHHEDKHKDKHKQGKKLTIQGSHG
ncbi:hypothetical protein [Umezawaea sp. Da 62-37]|uniref:hypothetical protein n=1 Tax=Umezawaea sp. Da 62-37 TaxID=3075927 RepID=UPI0028F7353A|nr:hypothetical protein [Umezawaea sp. Da 62-37]WNV86184.1 hypothetical protein RM788_50090 [Umezawaea sp. Da 62-37]